MRRSERRGFMKKLFSALLALALVMGLTPVSAMADGTVTVAVLSSPDDGGTVTLSGSAVGNGTDEAQAIYPVGTSFTATASAAPGYVFERWYDVYSHESYTENPLTLTAASDMTLNAMFNGENEYWIYCPDLPTSPNHTKGTVDVYPAQNSYAPGTLLTLTASAATNYTFEGYEWGYDVDGNESSVTSWTRISGNTLSMPAGTIWIRGIFRCTQPHSITVNCSQGGTYSISPAGPYYEGDTVTLTAIPDTGCRLKSTSGLPAGFTSSDNVYTIPMSDEDLTIHLEFEELPSVNLTVVSFPSAGGAVTGAQDPVTGKATVTAAPSDGFFFVGWIDYDDQSTVLSRDPAYVFTPERDLTLVGVFQQYLAAPAAGGTVSVQRSDSSGEVTLSAAAASGYDFAGWYWYNEMSGENAAPASTDAVWTFLPPLRTVSDPLAAVFVSAAGHSVYVASNIQHGSVTVAGEKSCYAQGETVTLTAVPDEGWTLDYFAAADMIGGSVQTPVRLDGNSFVMPDNDVAVTAVFARLYAVSVSSDPSKGGTVSGGGSYKSGASVTVTATANDGYAFANWTENGSVVSTEASISFTVTGDRTLTANFVPIRTVTLTADPAAGGTVSGGGSYKEGTSATVTATPASGYAFLNWTENGAVVSTEASYTFTVTGDRTLTACFSTECSVSGMVEWEDANNFGNTRPEQVTVRLLRNGEENQSASVSADAYGLWTFAFDHLPIVDDGGHPYVYTVSAENVDAYLQPPTVESLNDHTFRVRYLAASTAHTVTLTASPAAGGTLTGGGIYADGASVTVTATANDGYAFASWTENGSVVSTEASYAFTVSGDRTLVAHFEPTSVWEYTTGSGKTTITKYKGAGGDVTIPSELGGAPVTAIGEKAFSSCSTLTSVTVPEGVTSIGAYAFEECAALKSVTLPASLMGVESNAFYICYALESVYISDLTAWCEIDFADAGANPLGWGSGAGKESLLYLNGSLVTDLVIPDTLTTVKPYSFYGCTSITSLTIPEGVTSIGKIAFMVCRNLRVVTIPASLTIVQDNAFQNTGGIREVHISDLAAWCDISFPRDSSCPLYEGFGEAGLWLNGEQIHDLVIPEGVTSIGDYAFSECSGLTSVTIPEGVTSIGDAAFSFCAGIPSVTLPDSLTSIGFGAFTCCPDLKTLTFGSGLTSITQYSFYCAGLESVTIPRTVTSIEKNAFFDNDCLMDVYYLGSKAQWDAVEKHEDWNNHCPWEQKVHFMCSVTLTADPTHGGTVTGGGLYETGWIDKSGDSSTAGASVTVTASAASDYAFVNWTETGSVVSTDASYTFTATGDRTLTANFEKMTYTVKFVNEDGTELQSGEVAYGETPSYTGETPTKPATAQYTYTFAGWTPEIVPVTGAATYTATYSSTINKYTVSFETSGGSAVAAQTLQYGEKPTKSADPTKEGNSFDGWYADAALTTPFDFTAPIEGDTVVYAKWTPNDYRLKSVAGASADASHSWTKGSGVNVILTAALDVTPDNSFAHYVRTEIDGSPVSASAREGSTIVTIKAAELQKLSVGAHTVTIVFDNGSVDIRLTVKADPRSPATGDNRTTGLWAALTIVAVMGMGGSALIGKKRRTAGKH